MSVNLAIGALVSEETAVRIAEVNASLIDADGHLAHPIEEAHLVFICRFRYQFQSRI